MPKPVVAIVGRPNVGKSTLFNRIAQDRIAIVEERPGVTRDRLYCEVEWQNQAFTLIDTGGIDTGDDDISRQIRGQAQVAIDQAQVIVFVVDGRAGLLAQDMETAALLRRANKPVVLCVNKVEEQEQALLASVDFYDLGFGDPVAISAEHGKNIGDLLDRLLAHMPAGPDDEEGDQIKVAVIGKPNVGKSSFVNRLLGEERVIVSDVPGTTRDAVDTLLVHEEHPFLLIDTAGLRKKKRVAAGVERYGVVRTLQAVERCDVAVLMLDAHEGLTEQDKKIGGYAHENGKGMVIVINKWDLVEKQGNTMHRYEQDIRRRLQFLSYAPMVFISVKTGQRVENVLHLVYQAAENRSLRIATGRLNEVLQDATAMAQTPSDKGVNLKIYYGVQVQVNPPVFILYVNKKEIMHFSYLRYLENRIREEFGFVGTPIRIITKERT